MLRILLQETYAIEDLLKYAPTEIYQTGNKTHYKLFNDFTLSNSIDWEVSADLKTVRGFLCLTDWENAETLSTDTLTRYIGIGSNDASSGNPVKLCALGFSPTVTDGTIWNTNGGAYGSDYINVKVKKVGNVYSFYFNNTLQASTTSTSMSTYSPLALYIRFGSRSSPNAYIKNIKVKAL